MILGFKQFFSTGTPTFFEEKILAGAGLMTPNILMGGGTKIHSMRGGNKWKPEMSIQMAYGVRTKQYRQFNKEIAELSVCKSTQRVFMTCYDELAISVDGRRLGYTECDILIQNDGLTHTQFCNWFFPVNGIGKWEGKIIHWTDFKY